MKSKIRIRKRKIKSKKKLSKMKGGASEVAVTDASNCLENVIRKMDNIYTHGERCYGNLGKNGFRRSMSGKEKASIENSKNIGISRNKARFIYDTYNLKKHLEGIRRENIKDYIKDIIVEYISSKIREKTSKGGYCGQTTSRAIFPLG